MKQFYTYLHCKPNGDPFYVGKGHGKRSHNFTQRNKHHKGVVGKYGIDNIVVLVFKKDSEESAFKSEIRLIKMIRNAGFILANQTDGGEGTSGNKLSLETRNKIGASAKGNKRRLGKTHTLETRAKISLGHAGKKCIFSDDHRANLSKAQIGNKKALGNKHSKMTRTKMSIAQMGNKKGLGNKNALGLKHSIETKERISATLKITWAARRTKDIK